MNITLHGYSGERMSRVLRIQEVIIGARYRRTEPESQQNDASVITDSHSLQDCRKLHDIRSKHIRTFLTMGHTTGLPVSSGSQGNKRNHVSLNVS